MTIARRMKNIVALVTIAAGVSVAAGAGTSIAGADPTMSTLSANTALTATEPAPPGTPKEENRAAENDDAMESCCYQQVVGADVTLRPGEFGHAGVTCPYNMGYPQLVMGGGAYNTAGGEVVLTDSYPIRYNQWVVYMKNNSPDRPFVIRAWATCAAFWPINVQPGG